MSQGLRTKKTRYALLLARRGAIGVLLRQVLSRACSTSRYVWLAKELDFAPPSGDAPRSHAPQLATSRDIQDILAGSEGEEGQDLYEILRRVSFFNRGFDDCYLFRTGSGDVCHFGWLLSARHNELIRSHYPPGTSDLAEGEALVENIFTFPSHRGKGVMIEVLSRLEDLARDQGLRRMVAYVEDTNLPSLKGFERAGYRPFAEEREIRRFFKIRRTGQIGRQA